MYLSHLDAFFLVQPEFITNPENSSVTEGKNVTLQCKVYGNPAPDVRWTKDGKAVNIADPSQINVSSTGNTSSLTIVSVVQADQGLYRCVANNSLNTTTSHSGKLTVHCEFFIVLFLTDAQLITRSTSLYISCFYQPRSQPG